MWRCVLLVVVLALAPGCDRSGVGEIYPVQGVLTLDGQPLTAESTTILFTPDVSRGNSGRFQPSGTVDETGRYSLMTQGKSGAPPGWYRVIVAAFAAPPEHPKKKERGKRSVAASLVPEEYGRAETTPLAVEVVPDPAPGAYDLKLSK